MEKLLAVYMGSESRKLQILIFKAKLKLRAFSRDIKSAVQLAQKSCGNVVETVLLAPA